MTKVWQVTKLWVLAQMEPELWQEWVKAWQVIGQEI